MKKMDNNQADRYLTRKEKACARMIEFTLTTITVVATAIIILLTGVVRYDTALALITLFASGFSLLLFAVGTAGATTKIMRRARRVCRARKNAYVAYAKKIQDNCDFLDSELVKAKARRNFNINIGN